jgi:hypothetical protein
MLGNEPPIELALMLTGPRTDHMDEARRIASNIAKLPTYLASSPDTPHD